MEDSSDDEEPARLLAMSSSSEGEDNIISDMGKSSTLV